MNTSSHILSSLNELDPEPVEIIFMLMTLGYQRRMPPIRVGFHDHRRGDPGGHRRGGGAYLLGQIRTDLKARGLACDRVALAFLRAEVRR